MWTLARLSKHPALSGYFELVHPIFWPILLWHLKKVALQVDDAGRDNALIRITWWGGVYLEYLGDRIEAPSAYRPLTLSRPHWSDESWSTALPAQFSPQALPFILLRDNGGGGSWPSQLTEGGLFPPALNTS